MPERGGAPFRQIFLSRNGAPVNVVYHRRNADTAARTVSIFITLCTVLRKIIEIVATRYQILKLKCTTFYWGSASDPAVELTMLPRSPSWI